MNSHYHKYKDTIKRATKRHRRKREIWVRDYLSDESCSHCGESETACLMFFPDNQQIVSLSKKVGLNEDARKEVLSIIYNNRIVCSNCYIKLDNDIIDIM
jgi:hypothetical protein